jgi:hypothetical protein
MPEDDLNKLKGKILDFMDVSYIQRKLDKLEGKKEEKPIEKKAEQIGKKETKAELKKQPKEKLIELLEKTIAVEQKIKELEEKT